MILAVFGAGRFLMTNSSESGDTGDSKTVLMGDIAGGEILSNTLGVNERRLFCFDAIFVGYDGVKNGWFGAISDLRICSRSRDDHEGNGGNGDNGEFGVWMLRYIFR